MDLYTARQNQINASLKDQHLDILLCDDGEYILASEGDISHHPELKNLKLT